MKSLIILSILLLIVGSVSAATDCTSYFSKSVSKRDKAINAFSALVASSDRLSSGTDSFYNVLDDMYTSDNLTDASDYFSDFVDYRNNVNDDISNINDALSAYNSAIRDDYSDLPAACRTVYYSYTSDYDDMNTYYRHIKTSWTNFDTKYKVIYGYYSNLDNRQVSDIKTYVKNIQDYADKITSDAEDSLGEIEGGSFQNDTSSVYNQSECFTLVAASMDTVRSEMAYSCKRQLDNVTKSCPTAGTLACPVCQACPDCNSILRSEQDRYVQCQGQVIALQTQLATQGTVATSNCVAVNDQNTQLQKQLQDANALNTNLAAQLRNNTASACPQCASSCLMYQLIALGLLLLILMAWIFAL